jgi:hypothetical protein
VEAAGSSSVSREELDCLARTCSFFSCLRTILILLYKLVKLVPLSLSFPRIVLNTKLDNGRVLVGAIYNTNAKTLNISIHERI